MSFFAKPFKASFILSYGALFLILSLWSFAIIGVVHSTAIYSNTFWHAHEIIYGVWGLSMFGFIATAAPNWTGENAPSRYMTLCAVVTWLAYRIFFSFMFDVHQIYFSILFSISWWSLSSFIIARLVIRPKHTRGILILTLYIFIASQDLGYLALKASGFNGEAAIVIKSTILFYTSLIGIVYSKIFPFFCMKAIRYYEKKDMQTINAVTAAVSALGAALYLCSSFITSPFAPGWVMVLVGVLNWIRLYLWSDRGILSNSMLLFPYIAMLNIATGLILLGIANIAFPLYFTDVLHFVSIAGISLMFSTIMLRVYLGHTGNRICANLWVKCAFLLVVVAGLLRSTFSLSSYEPLYLILSALLLISATLILQYQFIHISTQKV